MFNQTPYTVSLTMETVADTHIEAVEEFIHGLMFEDRFWEIEVRDDHDGRMRKVNVRMGISALVEVEAEDA